MDINEIQEKVNAFLVDELEIDESKIEDDARLKEDLGIDSLEVVDVIVLVEEEFGFKMQREDTGSSVNSSPARLPDYGHTGWQGSTDGTPWMQRTLIRLFRILPLGVLYGCMALVIPFYMLFAKGFKASYTFYRKRMGYGPVKSFFYVYKNEFAFGQVVLDRFAAYAGKKFDMEVPRMDLFRELCAGEDGFVQLSSHVGNYEMVGYSLVSPKPINALVFAGETATVMRNRALLFGATNVRMVPWFRFRRTCRTFSA